MAEKDKNLNTLSPGKKIYLAKMNGSLLTA